MIRLLDLIFSILAFICLCPLLIPISIILKFTGEGEVFYIQQRVGKGGKKFGLLKFATMLKDSPNIGSGEITLKNDPRVLPVGIFLRKSKINELPQILNIIKGDMSIIGPRPMVENTYKLYPPKSQELLNTIKPGLSGLGSIIFRDEESILAGREDPVEYYKTVIIPYKSDLEVWYVKNNTIINYFKCILLTIWMILIPNSKIFEKTFKDLPPKPHNFYND